ncbi:hypothetical protein RIVM261_079650 [Rivularia sp. IAM M-261]|nr:hypothetical protein RIVM261_079650 [Rivularia sp. IAM M-261]
MNQKKHKIVDKQSEELLLKNHERIGRGLIFLSQGLQVFVERQMQNYYATEWENAAKKCLEDKKHHIQSGEINLEDSQALLQIIINQRDNAFEPPILSRDDISLVFELAKVRRKWAHPRLRSWIDLKDFDPKYTYRSLDNILRLLSTVSAFEAVQKVEQLMQEVAPQLLQESTQSKNQFDSLIEKKTEGFVGREYVFKAIQEFLASHSNGYFIIKADPGVGKSSIMAEYARCTKCVAYFNQRSQGINRANQFLEDVCNQLISRYNLPYPSLPADATRDGKFFNQLLKEISTKIKAGERIVIAIDALDEVDQSDHIGGNILYLPETPPKGVCFILTQRPITLPFKVINVGSYEFDLMQYQVESIQDIQIYIHNRTNKSRQLQAWINKQGLTVENFVTQLGDKSENNFMYLRYVLDDIEREKYQDLSIDHLPQGLMAYYEKHWWDMGMAAKPLPRNKINIVYVLAELREPVSRILIADFAHEDAFVVQEVLDEWEQFLRSEQVDGQTCYSIYHSSFCDFLYRKDIVQAAGVTLKNIKSQIADDLWKGLYGDE